MNLIVYFMVLLQAWTAFCLRCKTNNGEVGICRRDCNTVDVHRSLTRCAGTSFFCCASSASTITSKRESKFPVNCGYTVMYASRRITGGIIRPDEYSWLASLQYRRNSNISCSGAVINSRYVLTAAECVTGASIKDAGGLTGVRLGDYDKHGDICDYGTESCTHYLHFGIEDIIVHSDYKRTADHVVNNIALIRLDRSIQLGNRIKPICLPFGNNFISEEPVTSALTVIGWRKTLANNDFVAKSEKSVILSKTERCKAIFALDNTNICVVESDSNAFKGGLLMREFAHRRWVLEGIASSISIGYSEIKDCSEVNRETSRVYTRVRSYADWLNEKMEMKSVINEQLQY